MDTFATKFGLIYTLVPLLGLQTTPAQAAPKVIMTCSGQLDHATRCLSQELPQPPQPPKPPECETDSDLPECAEEAPECRIFWEKEIELSRVSFSDLMTHDLGFGFQIRSGLRAVPYTSGAFYVALDVKKGAGSPPGWELESMSVMTLPGRVEGISDERYWELVGDIDLHLFANPEDFALNASCSLGLRR
jgi:hypothetical protein